MFYGRLVTLSALLEERYSDSEAGPEAPSRGWSGGHCSSDVPGSGLQLFLDPFLDPFLDLFLDLPHASFL